MDIERVRKELQASALREFPNPERVGCPDPAVLDAMSRRTIEITQSQLHHITHCSPCFQTFLSIREEIRKRRAIRLRIAAAACAAVIVVGAIIYTVADRLKSPAQVAGLAHARHARSPSVERISRNRIGPCHSSEARADSAEEESAFDPLFPGGSR